MTSIILTSAGAIVPRTVAGYRSTRPVRTIEQPILGSPDSDFTFRPAGLRSGIMTLVFDTEAEALTAESRLLLLEAFTFTTDAIDGADMTFVVIQPGIDRELAVGREWTLTVPYKERAA